MLALILFLPGATVAAAILRRRYLRDGFCWRSTTSSSPTSSSASLPCPCPSRLPHVRVRWRVWIVIAVLVTAIPWRLSHAYLLDVLAVVKEGGVATTSP